VTGAELPTRRELAVAAGLILAFVLALYLPYSFEGGLYTDDYSWLQAAKYDPILGPGGLVDELAKHHVRPLHGVGTLLQAQVFGGDEPLVFVPSLSALVLQCFALYWLLRQLRVGRLPAAGATALLVSVPWVDATRLWLTMAHEGLAVAIWLLGLCVAVAGLRAGTPWRRWAAVGASLFLYACSALMYEGTAVAIALSGLLYLGAAPRRAALVRWGIDLGFVVVAGVAGAAALERRGARLDLGHMIDRARQLGHAWIELVRFSVPADTVFWGPLGLALAVAAAIGLGRAWQRGGDERARVLSGATVTGTALLFAAAGLATLVSTVAAYSPVLQGTENRYAVVTAPGTAVFLMGATWLLVLGLTSLTRRQRLAVPVTAGILLLTLAGLVHQERQSQDLWIAAGKEQDRLITDMETALGGRPPRGAALLTVRHANFTPIHVPVFTTPYDLRGRLQLDYGDPTLEAHPYQLPVRCNPADIRFAPTEVIPFTSNVIPYGPLTYAVDIPTKTVLRLTDLAACQRLAADMANPVRVGRPPWLRLSPSS
jgi:hypothetical protein